jgi:predicted esterase
MTFAGRPCSFLLVLPERWADKPRPLLLALHGAGDDARSLLDGGARCA